MLLSRSAWAGVSKFGAAVWNGDTESKWSFLSAAIRSGLNIQLSGIAWWTTDIGGYANGKPADPDFRELVVRWFQFGATCPLFLQHGARDTEPWLLGAAALAQVRRSLALREELSGYVLAELAETAASGLPLNRPLFFDFPSDAAAGTSRISTCSAETSWPRLCTSVVRAAVGSTSRRAPSGAITSRLRATTEVRRLRSTLHLIIFRYSEK